MPGGERCSNVIEMNAPIHEPAAANSTYVQSRVYVITANDESKYQTLLHVAAEIRLRPDTAAVNNT